MGLTGGPSQLVFFILNASPRRRDWFFEVNSSCLRLPVSKSKILQEGSSLVLFCLHGPLFVLFFASLSSGPLLVMSHFVTATAKEKKRAFAHRTVCFGDQAKTQRIVIWSREGKKKAKT